MQNQLPFFLLKASSSESHGLPEDRPLGVKIGIRTLQEFSLPLGREGASAGRITLLCACSPS